MADYKLKFMIGRGKTFYDYSELVSLLRYPAGKALHQGVFLLFCLIRKGMQ